LVSIELPSVVSCLCRDLEEIAMGQNTRFAKPAIIVLVIHCLLSFRALAATRTFEFETSEVTQPGLSAAPDGRSIVFNLVGHLFRLPVTGGAATQLTFGPYYDSDPVFSPDGSRIAFVSNRDGSDGNIFILEVSSGKISQLTRDYQAGLQAWSRDGKTIAYVSFLKREEYPADRIPGFGASTPLGALSTIAVQGGAPQRLSPARAFGSLFYLADGSLAWTVAELGQTPQGGGRLQQGPPVTATIIEKRAADSTVSRVGSIPGAVFRPALNPQRDGIYYIGGGSVRHYRFGDPEAKMLAPFAGVGSRVDVASDNQALYAATDAKLWRVSLAGANREQISWTARVKIETVERAVKKWNPPSSSTVEVTAILTPRISPDGRTLVFMAAGSLWEQPVGRGQARRLIDEVSYQLEPAFSPDGKQLAFVSDKTGKRELRVFDFATRQTRTLATVGGASWILFPSWSGDGKSVIFQRSDLIGVPYRFMRVDAQTGNAVQLAQSGGDWTGRPQLSADGNFLYYTGRPGLMANVYRLPLRDGANAEAVTDLTRHVHDALISPDGKWLAFRRNTEIWIGSTRPGVLKDQDFRRFSNEGGRSFSFTTDSSAIVYSEGSRVWRREIQTGRAGEIAISITLPRAVPIPVLLGRVRVLDLQAGKFSDETSMLIEQGRIRWIGSENGHSIPSNTVRVDAGGRYAIPGIMDSHTHTAWSNQQISEDSLIAYGVTSVRDTGSRLDVINALRNRGDSTNLPIPRYFAGGDIFEGLMPLWGDAFLEITDKEEAREYVRYWKDMGASFIKVYASLPWFVKSEVAAEANRLGMPVVGHGLSVEEIVRSVNFGITSLEHGPPLNDDIVKLLASSGTRLDPTLTVFGQGTPSKMADPATVDAKFRTFIPEDAIAAGRPGRPVPEAQRSTWINSIRTYKKLHDSGVKLLDGTDALMTSVFFGPSVHWELQFYTWAGLAPIDVLRMATIDAADAVGAAGDLGSLEPGKVGDVVLLDADPTLDIANTMKIWRVIKGGHVFDPATMRK
jgi:Tol biopolymer transport system component/imidazolonepropionase-like amidohydrolase